MCVLDESFGDEASSEKKGKKRRKKDSEEKKKRKKSKKAKKYEDDEVSYVNRKNLYLEFFFNGSQIISRNIVYTIYIYQFS